MTGATGYGSWSAGWLLCPDCANQLDMHGPSAACEKCRAIRQLRMENDRLMQIIDAASNVLVPKADYDRVVAERDEQRSRADLAQSSCDALTRELQDARDASRARAAERACRALQRVMATLARSAGGPGDLDAWSEARAFLAEMGYVAPEVEEYRAAYERWEEG